MFRALKLLVAMLFFLVVFAGTVAPALQRMSSKLESLMVPGGGASGVIGTTETVLYLGMPLLLLGGVVILIGLIAVGLRGTSFT